jgi:cytoskeleton protein RodZ
MAELPAAAARSGTWTRWLIPLGLLLALAAGIVYFEFDGMPGGMRKARKDATEAVVAMPASPSTGPAPPAIGPSPVTTVSPETEATGKLASTTVPGVPPDASASPVPAPGVQVDSKAAPQADKSVAVDAGRIDLALSGTSWVEIKDARGITLLSKTLTGEVQQSITGNLPLSVKIGNARAVRSLQFNGSPIELAPYTQREVARLTLPLPRR